MYFFSISDIFIDIAIFSLIASVAGLLSIFFLDFMYICKDAEKPLYECDWQYYKRYGIDKNCPSVRFWKENRFAYSVWLDEQCRLRNRIYKSISVVGQRTCGYGDVYDSLPEVEPFMDWFAQLEPWEQKFYRGYNKLAAPGYPGENDMSLVTTKDVMEYKEEVRRKRIRGKGGKYSVRRTP